MQGTRDRDFTEANRLAGFNKTPKEYTWHHLADFDPTTGTCTMQLVKTSAHEASFPHMGAVAQFEQYHGVKYTARGGSVDVVEKAGRLRRPRRKKKGACGT